MQHLVFAPMDCCTMFRFMRCMMATSYLIDKYSVSYAPSASVYSLCREKAANLSGGSLILGIADAQAPLILEEVEALRGILPDSSSFWAKRRPETVLKPTGP